MKIVKAYVERLDGLSFNSVLIDLLIRSLSLICFPLIYLALSFFNYFYPVRIGFLYRSRLGHLISNTDLYLRRKYLGEESGGLHIFFTYRPANRQVCKLFSRVIPLVDSEFLTKLFAPIAIFNTKFSLKIPFIGNEYRERLLAPSQVNFTLGEVNAGKKKLREMGISENDWYVCIHARDNAFTLSLPGGQNYIESGNYRNADIDTYDLAAMEVVKRGGFVIRMGSVVEKEFSLKHPKIIDYPFHFRDDFSDVYISANAKFFISTANGSVDLAQLFDVPILLVNVVPIGFSPLSKNSLYIPKRIFNSNGEQINFYEQLLFFKRLPLNAAINPLKEFDRRGWIVKDNTREEIRDAAIEMFNQIESRFELSPEYSKLLTEYYDLFDEDNMYSKSKAPCAQFFLETLDLSKIKTSN